MLGKCSTIELHPQPFYIMSVSGIINIPVTVNIFLKRKKNKTKPKANKIHIIRLDGYVPTELYLLA